MDYGTLERANELKKEIERLNGVTSRVLYGRRSIIKRVANKYLLKTSYDESFVLQDDEVQVLERYLYKKCSDLEREFKKL